MADPNYWSWASNLYPTPQGPDDQTSWMNPQTWPMAKNQGPAWDPTYRPGQNPAQPGTIGALLGYKQDPEYQEGMSRADYGHMVDQLKDVQQPIQTMGLMANPTSSLAMLGSAGANAASGDTTAAAADAGFAAMPYLGQFIKPFLKYAAAPTAAGAALLMPDAQGSSAEAKEKKNQAPGTQTAANTPGPSAGSVGAPAASPQNLSLEDQESREIAQLQADRDKAIEQGKHSKQPPGEKSMMAQAADNYNTAAQATKDRYRDLRGLRDLKQSVFQPSNPEFAGLPPGQQTEINQQPTAVAAQDLYNQYVNANRPFAQQHPGAVAAGELAGFGLGTYLPYRGAAALGRQVGRTESALAKAGSSVVPNPIYENRLNTQLGKLDAQTAGSHNFLTEHVMPMAGHSAVGAAMPYFAGTLAPNLMDTFTKPHDSATYKHAVSMFDPTNPEAQDAAKRALVEGTVAAGAGHGLGHGMNSTALQDAKGLLAAAGKRTAGYDAPVGMRQAVPQGTPMQQAMTSPAAVGPGTLSKASTPLEDNFGIAGRVTGDYRSPLPRDRQGRPVLTNPRTGNQFKKTIRIDRGND